MSNSSDRAGKGIEPPLAVVDPPEGYAVWLAELKARVYAVDLGGGAPGIPLRREQPLSRSLV